MRVMDAFATESDLPYDGGSRELFDRDTDSSERETDSDSFSDSSLESSTTSDDSEPPEASSSLQQHYNFVKDPSPDVYCPVTLEVLLDPCQTLCCGNHLSLFAAQKLKRTKKRCPLCKQYPLKFVKDKYFLRTILAMKVYCSKKDSGCTWIGEVRDLKSHLSIDCVDDGGKCGYVEIPCPYGCGDHVQRNILQSHMSNDCLKRPFSCPHCQCMGKYESITRDHWTKCNKFPLQCPNECSSDTIQRYLLKRHLSEDCPLQEVECEFDYVGCKSRVKRCKLNEHMDENQQFHLRSLAKYTQQLNTHVSNTLLLSRNITFPNFEWHKRKNLEWYSPPFYTHIGGYKMCLGIDANGFSSSTGTHIGIAVYMMRGEFDTELEWPFKGAITIELLDQSGGGKNYAVNVVEENSYNEKDYETIFSKVTETERSPEGWGFAEFISHKNLYKPKQGRKYLNNDSLYFKVTKIVVT